MILRPYRGDDFEALAEIESQCFPDGAQRFSREYLSQILSSNFSIVAEEGDEIVGFVVCLLRDGPYIETLDVAPKFQRKGIATVLLKSLEAILADTGHTTIGLHVAENNSGAINLYNLSGYKLVEKVKSFYTDGTGAFRMSKELEQNSLSANSRSPLP